jgi:erythromycin esterase
MTDDTPTTVSTDEQAATDHSETASDENRSRRDALDEHAVALDTTDPTADLDDLASLHDVFADARIVGLGEATHGTREFFRLKHRLLRYLVTELDVRVFGLEANFPEALALDEYVVHGEGDPVAALAGVYFWTWQVESVLGLVEWLRAFNADRPLEDCVRFYGFDAQYTQGPVDEIVAFFQAVDPDFLETVREDLETVADDGTSAYADEHREARIEAADRVLPALHDRPEQHRGAYVEETSERDLELAARHVRVVEQAIEHRRAVHDRQEGTVDEPPATERCLRVRDRAMAETVEWILEFEDADRMAIWAHDAHLNRVENTSRDTDAAATSLGGHRADHYGDDYFALGFSFGRGSFQAFGEDPDAEDEEPARGLHEFAVDGPLRDTLEATLADLDQSPAVVNLRSAREDDRVAEWLAAPRRHFSIGSTFDPENPEEYVTEYTYSEAFDAVCYVEETTRARPIEQD